VSVTITGLADLNAVLNAVAPREAKNLLRATVLDIAKQLAAEAKGSMPEDSGDMIAGTKAKRDRGTRDSIEASVGVTGAYYWRFLEYGQGPDGLEYAFFLKALQAMRPDMERVYLEAFGRKLAARLARERKRKGA
jgi:HK97 gp10 family phage protein